MGEAPRLLTELTTAQSMHLLGSVSLGRVVFTMQALPAVWPVSHIVDEGAIIIRSHCGAAVVSAARGVTGAVVAYEADSIDPAAHLGWSVIATGLAWLVTDPPRIARYREALRPWVAGQMDYVVRIHPEIVTGFELTGGATAGAPCGG